MKGQKRAIGYSTHFTRPVLRTGEHSHCEKSSLLRDAPYMPSSDIVLRVRWGYCIGAHNIRVKSTHSQVDVTIPSSLVTTVQFSVPEHLVCTPDDGPVPRTASPRHRTNKRLLAERLRRMKAITTMTLTLAPSITTYTIQRLLRRVFNRRWWSRRRVRRFRQPPGIMDIHQQQTTELNFTPQYYH